MLLRRHLHLLSGSVHHHPGSSQVGWLGWAVGTVASQEMRSCDLDGFQLGWYGMVWDGHVSNCVQVYPIPSGMAISPPGAITKVHPQSSDVVLAEGSS